ncbi:MAG: acyl carrier protein [Candidatus Methanofastidiosum sp.]|jgi:acyl carrier protein|nr:acyl carrier protein [Methanofastidiosum sp.]
MKVSEFIEKLKETLELEDEELNEDTNLKDLEEYDSLSVLSIIAMIDENFGKQLSAQQFSDVTTVKSLIEKIGVENFE